MGYPNAPCTEGEAVKYYAAFHLHIVTFVSMCFWNDVAKAHQTSVEDVPFYNESVYDINARYCQHQRNFRTIFANNLATRCQRVEKTYQTYCSINALQARPLLTIVCDFSHCRISQSSIAISNGRLRGRHKICNNPRPYAKVSSNDHRLSRCVCSIASMPAQLQPVCCVCWMLIVVVNLELFPHGNICVIFIYWAQLTGLLF